MLGLDAGRKTTHRPSLRLENRVNATSSLSFAGSPWGRLGLVAVLLALVTVLYWAGAKGPLVLDDIPNLAAEPDLIIDEFSLSSLRNASFSSEAGPLSRPVAMATFALNTYFSDGLDPFAVKLTNIVIHALTTIVVFLLTLQLLSRLAILRSERTQDFDRFEPAVFWPAVLVAALWSLHPLHVSTVLYAVQRMAELAGLFAFTGAALYVRGRVVLLAGRDLAGALYMSLALLGCGTLAMLSKENGALLPTLLLIIEMVFFRLQLGTGTPRVFRPAIIVALVLPTLFVLGYLAYVWMVTDSPAPRRDFGPGERLLTETRVLFHHVGQIFWPDVSRMSLLHGDYPVSRSLTEPTTTLWAALGWLVVIGSALLSVYRRKAPVLAFGVLWFVAGHLLESTVIPLELVFEHRNYLPSYGLLFAAGYGLARLGQFTGVRPSVRIFLVVGVLLALGSQLQLRVSAWSTHERFFLHELAVNPTAPRAWVSLAYAAYVNGLHQDAAALYQRAAELEPQEAGHLVGVFRMGVENPSVTPPAGLMDEILRRVEQGPLTAYGAGQLVGLGMRFRQQSRDDATHVTTASIILSQAARNPAWPNADLHASTYFLLAELRQRQQDWQGMLEALYAGLALRPDRPKARLTLAAMLFRLDRTEEAREHMARVQPADFSPDETARLEHLEKLLSRPVPPYDDGAP